MPRKEDKLSLLEHVDYGRNSGGGGGGSGHNEIPGSTDRLGDLLRGTSEADRDYENGGRSNSSKQDIEMEEKSSTSEFLRWAEDIKERMRTYASNVKRIEDMHTEALTSIIATSHKPGSNSELDNLMDESQEIAKNIRNQLKKMEMENKEKESSLPKGSAEIRIRTSTHTTLSRKFMELMTSYQKTQEKFKQGYKDRMERQYRTVNATATAEEVRRVVEGETDASQMFQVATMSLGAVAARNALADITEKHREILKLEESLVELHQLFQDMATMVEAQGEMLNNIEHIVEESGVYVEKGNEQLVEAKKLQKSARKKMCIIICCLLCLLAIGASLLMGFLKFSTFGIVG